MGRYAFIGDGEKRIVRKLRDERPRAPEFIERVRGMSEDRRFRVGALLSWMLGIRLDQIDAGERFRLAVFPLLFLGAVVIPMAVFFLQMAFSRSSWIDASVVAGLALGGYVVGSLATVFRSARRR